MPVVYVLNGPNLNLTGTRQPHIYGRQTLSEIRAMLEDQGDGYDVEIDFRQTNHEGTLIDWLHEAREKQAKAVLLNAGAYTHTSIALYDAIIAIELPVYEVHLSQPMEREAFRHISYVGMAARASFAGHGAGSYAQAFDAAMAQ